MAGGALTSEVAREAEGVNESALWIDRPAS